MSRQWRQKSASKSEFYSGRRANSAFVMQHLPVSILISAGSLCLSLQPPPSPSSSAWCKWISAQLVQLVSTNSTRLVLICRALASSSVIFIIKRAQSISVSKVSALVLSYCRANETHFVGRQQVCNSQVATPVGARNTFHEAGRCAELVVSSQLEMGAKQLSN